MNQAFGTSFKKISLMALFCIATGIEAKAYSNFPGQVSASIQKLYNSQTSVSCNLCHSGSGGFQSDFAASVSNNGFSLGSLSQSQTDTVIKAMENLDSDGDGYNNKEEFTASTDPSDAASKPAAVAAVPVEQPVVQPVVQPDTQPSGGMIADSTVPSGGTQASGAGVAKRRHLHAGSKRSMARQGGGESHASDTKRNFARHHEIESE